ncbi:MAG: LppX_LprAFG lipoprotein [Anaerolineae bacterium]
MKFTRAVSLILSLAVLAILSACTGTPSDTRTASPTPIDPLALVTEAANRIRAAQTFRMDVNEEGPDYRIETAYASVYFRHASAQYAAPGVMQAEVSVIEPLTRLRIDVGVFARAENQWYRAIWTGNTWINEAFAVGFNPQSLIAEDTGFNAALSAIIDLRYIGDETLESGVETYHVSGGAHGEDVNALLVGLIETGGDVTVDIFIAKDTLYPVRFIITEENSPWAVTPEAGEDPQPIRWIMDLYGINEPVEFDEPQTEATAEATLEATAEASPGSAFLGAG